MARYFIEVSYKGTEYSGFQIQKNSNSIQAEIEKALSVFFKQKFSLTGASRTDSGVHALQNYFHFDTIPSSQEKKVPDNLQVSDDSYTELDFEKAIYNLNAILPRDILIKKILKVDDKAHCRFNAISREYEYIIYSEKNPFLEDRAYYYPYPLDIGKLMDAAQIILSNNDFTSFSKKNTQVKDFICHIKKSEWEKGNDTLVYRVKSNRFLRGMVKGLVGTMLRVGTGKITLERFRKIIENKDCTKADFSVPPGGLFLMKVQYEFIQE